MSVRSAGGGHGHGHGHDEHHHEYHYDKSNQEQTKFKIPTQEDIDYQLPKRGVINEKFHKWLAGRWAVDRDDILDNDKVNKFSAYYWWGNSAL